MDVRRNFHSEDVNGELTTSVTDVRTGITFRFSSRHHFVHVYTASLNNVDGEAYGFISNRGGQEYPPVIICSRFGPAGLLFVIKRQSESHREDLYVLIGVLAQQARRKRACCAVFC